MGADGIDLAVSPFVLLIIDFIGQLYPANLLTRLVTLEWLPITLQITEFRLLYQEVRAPFMPSAETLGRVVC